MDNDLMAHRLRPSSQPSSSSGQSPAQPPAPWDVPLTDEGSFAPAQPAQPPQDPPFVPPDPAARDDVPWDRPAPESWPAADPLVDAAPPWDRPARDHTLDPDDAMAPVVADVNAPAGLWPEWMSSGATSRAGAAAATGYATASAPEPMTVAAHSDQPRGGDEPRPDARADAGDRTTAIPGAASTGGAGPSLPEWPAEDDLTPPLSSRDAVLPEELWPTTPSDSTPPAPEETPAPASAAEPSGVHPAAPPHSFTPVVKSAQILPSPPGSPQNMVLRIELAIVDESHANSADAARRVGPEADVRAREYNPRTHVDRVIPEPEYVWDVPLAEVQGQVGPPPNAWPPGPAQPTQHTTQPAPWSTPAQHEPHVPPPVAPPPTWALTGPTPPSAPEPPQYTPPSAWPPSPSPDPLSGLPAASSAAGDHAEPLFPSNQSAAAAAAAASEDDAQSIGKSSAIVTAALTVGFALLVIVLVLVFIQLMTSLLR